MITPKEIRAILNKHSSNAGSEWHKNIIIYDSSFDTIAEEIYGLIRNQSIENIELQAKIRVYEAVLDNSNFKMAVIRKRKEEE